MREADYNTTAENLFLLLAVYECLSKRNVTSAAFINSLYCQLKCVCLCFLTSTSPVSFSLRTKLSCSGSGPAINLRRSGRSHRGSFWNRSGGEKHKEKHHSVLSTTRFLQMSFQPGVLSSPCPSRCVCLYNANLRGLSNTMNFFSKPWMTSLVVVRELMWICFTQSHGR